MAALPLPRIDHLRKQLRLDADDGRIWLGEQRMALIHVQSLAALRRELIDSLGTDKARGLLTRMGYTSGVQDADMARRAVADQSFQDAFLAGPRLHMLEGMVAVEFERMEIDVERGHFYAQVVWTQSIEVDCHRLHYGPSIEPVCWMEIGYAAGYTTAYLGRPVLYREVECRGAGGGVCRIVGKPLDEWGGELEDLRHFQSEAFVNRIALRAPAAAATPKATVEVADDDMVGLSPGFNAATHLVRKVASTKATVLFLGETGVGKELFARNLHRESDRATGPFVAVNCAAIPDNLLEAELFGVEKGAFTGALASRPGRFERAAGGTLFLDEIGTLALEAQGKLLRALQTGEIERVGDVRTRKVDVRLVAATNEDLKFRVQDGSFRSDLYYRLNVFPIRIPPLRERRDDVPLLMRAFLARFSRMHRKQVTGFTERAIRALHDYEFPGNIRELENMIERAVILASDGGPLDVSFLFSDGGSPAEPARHAPDPGRDEVERAVTDTVGRRPLSLEALERSVVMTAVERAGGNLASAARMIGLTRRQLAYRLKAAADRRSPPLPVGERSP